MPDAYSKPYQMSKMMRHIEMRHIPKFRNISGILMHIQSPSLGRNFPSLLFFENRTNCPDF